MLRSSSLLLLAVVLGCSTSKPADDTPLVTDDAGPDWLGDAGLVTRAPEAKPLHTMIGISADLPLGADANSIATRKASFDAALDLGGVMIRHDFLWGDIEPVKGTRDYSGYDRIVGDATTRGVRLLPILDYGVKWANAAATDDDFPPTDPADFARFAGATAQRYQGKMAAWEVWNEPNNGLRFWKGTPLSGDPAAYGALLSSAHEAIRAADGTTPVMLGGTVFTPQLIEGAIPWLEEAYAAHPDLATRFEIAGIHTYAFYPPESAPEHGERLDPPLEAKIQMHAWLLAQHGGSEKPIWITEIGWPVQGPVDEATQARFTVRATILAAHAGASAIFWYTLRDGPHPEAFPPEDAFGLLRNDGTQKPAYVALKTLLARVGERWATTDDPKLHGMPSDARAVVFRGAAGKALICAWTVDTPRATVTLDGGGMVFDQLGAPQGSTDTITLTQDVTYIETP